MVIIVNTFRNLLKWKNTLLYLIVISILPVIIGFVLKYEVYDDNLSFTQQFDTTMGIYHIVVFMWILGIPFLINGGAKGIALMANELSDGTLGLLVSTRLPRQLIILYKWLALYLVLLILGTVSIFVNYSIITFISGMDDNIQIVLINSIPYLLKYVCFVSLIVSAVSILLSLLIKSKISAVITITVFIIFLFLLFPLLKNIVLPYYEKYYLYYLDFNYQFSLIYYHFIDNNVVTVNQANIMGMFMGIFDLSKSVDNDLTMMIGQKILNGESVYDFFNLKYLIMSWLIFSLSAIAVSMGLLTKRDIT